MHKTRFFFLSCSSCDQIMQLCVQQQILLTYSYSESALVLILISIADLIWIRDKIILKHCILTHHSGYESLNPDLFLIPIYLTTVLFFVFFSQYFIYFGLPSRLELD